MTIATTNGADPIAPDDVNPEVWATLDANTRRAIADLADPEAAEIKRAIATLHRYGAHTPDITLPSGTVVRDREVAEAYRRESARRAARAALDAEAAQSGIARIPAPTTLADLLAEPDDPVTFRIDKLLPSGGRALFYGPRKAGKSSIEQDLVRCLVDGEPFLGRYTVTPPEGAVGLIDDELSRSQLRRWLRDKGIRNADKVSLFPIRGNVAAFNILDDATRTAWADRLRAAGITFLIVDCLRPVLDALSLDENHDAGRFVVAFDALLDEAGVSEAVLTHHTGHAGDRARGDSRLMDWPDALWRLGTEKPDDPFAPRFFSAFGRDVAEPERRLSFDPLTRRLSAGDTRGEGALSDACAVVRDALRGGGGPMSARALESRCVELASNSGGDGIPRSRIREAIEHLTVTGALDRAEGPRRAQLYSLLDCAEDTE